MSWESGGGEREAARRAVPAPQALTAVISEQHGGEAGGDGAATSTPRDLGHSNGSGRHAADAYGTSSWRHEQEDPAAAGVGSPDRDRPRRQGRVLQTAGQQHSLAATARQRRASLTQQRTLSIGARQRRISLAQQRALSISRQAEIASIEKALEDTGADEVRRRRRTPLLLRFAEVVGCLLMIARLPPARRLGRSPTPRSTSSPAKWWPRSRRRLPGRRVGAAAAAGACAPAGAFAPARSQGAAIPPDRALRIALPLLTLAGWLPLRGLQGGLLVL